MTQKINLSETRVGLIQHNNSCYNVHDNLKGKSVEELKEITQANLNPFWVMCLNIMGDLNISTIIRSSHMFGAERVVIFGRRRIDNRGLVGSSNYTTIDRVDGLLEDQVTLNKELFVTYCEDNKLFPIFVEQGGCSVYKLDWQEIVERCNAIGKKPCIIVGEENSGIPDYILNLYSIDQIVSIPQRGVIRSFNCSQAFAVVASQMIGNLGWE